MCKCFLSVCVLVTNAVTVTAAAATSGDIIHRSAHEENGPSSRLSRVQFIGTISHTGPSTGLHCAGSGKKLIISQIAGVLSSLVRYCSAGLLIPSLPSPQNLQLHSPLIVSIQLPSTPRSPVISDHWSRSGTRARGRETHNK